MLEEYSTDIYGLFTTCCVEHASREAAMHSMQVWVVEERGLVHVGGSVAVLTWLC